MQPQLSVLLHRVQRKGPEQRAGSRPVAQSRHGVAIAHALVVPGLGGARGHVCVSLGAPLQLQRDQGAPRLVVELLAQPASVAVAAAIFDVAKLSLMVNGSHVTTGPAERIIPKTRKKNHEKNHETNNETPGIQTSELSRGRSCPTNAERISHPGIGGAAAGFAHGYIEG